MCKSTRKKNEGKWIENDTYLVNKEGHETSLTKLIIPHLIHETLGIGNASSP